MLGHIAPIIEPTSSCYIHSVKYTRLIHEDIINESPTSCNRDYSSVKVDVKPISVRAFQAVEDA